jgi:hypothetical protein
MRIWEPSRWLLVKVTCTANWLYVLDINIAQPVCLAACGKEDAWC